MDQYIRGAVLGEGTFGAVYKAVHKKVGSIGLVPIFTLFSTHKVPVRGMRDGHDVWTRDMLRLEYRYTYILNQLFDRQRHWPENSPTRVLSNFTSVRQPYSFLDTHALQRCSDFLQLLIKCSYLMWHADWTGGGSEESEVRQCQGWCRHLWDVACMHTLQGFA